MYADNIKNGYTLMIGSISTICINPSLHKKLPFDTVKDLASISLMASTPSRSSGANAD